MITREYLCANAITIIVIVSWMLCSSLSSCGHDTPDYMIYHVGSGVNIDETKMEHNMQWYDNNNNNNNETEPASISSITIIEDPVISSAISSTSNDSINNNHHNNDNKFADEDSIIIIDKPSHLTTIKDNIRATTSLSAMKQPTAIVGTKQPTDHQDHRYEICPCPCRDEDSVYSPICAQTTNGQFRTFNSQCHLICYNQCQINMDRYALMFHHSCPVFLILQNNLVRYKLSGQQQNRQPESTDITASQADWICDCSHCTETKWYRFDYYPICTEKAGQKFTFESWCHFDCENKCIRHTGYTYLYLHRGYCVPDMHDIDKTDSNTEVDMCHKCSSQCFGLYKPICAKGPLGEYLSFKSRCHLRCHNQCYFQNRNAYFIQVNDGDCRWL